jgi:hypothetical protein
MDNENRQANEPVSIEKIFELFSLIKKKQNITIRDDQYDFPTILDAVRQFREKRYRFRLIDTGRFDPFELEWITSYGADIYTSDESRSNVLELDIIGAAARRGKALVAFLINGELESEGGNALSASDLLNVGRSGIYIHLTNRQQERDIPSISRLAYNCTKSGSWLVYYHHGPLETPLLELGKNGAWIHITDQSLKGEEDRTLIRDIVLSAQKAGSNMVLHWENGGELSVLDDIVKAGAVVLFKSPLFDYKSPLKDLEKGIRRKRLDYRAYYLHPSVLP